jgi:ribosomal protein S27AE
MAQTEAIECPGCGARMNHHADKFVDSVEDQSAGFAGLVLHVHTCPSCGKVETRKQA